jgi:hypothetical protein
VIASSEKIETPVRTNHPERPRFNEPDAFVVAHEIQDREFSRRNTKFLHRFFVHTNCTIAFRSPSLGKPRLDPFIKGVDARSPIVYPLFDTLARHLRANNFFEDVNSREAWTPLTCNINVGAIRAFYPGREARAEGCALCLLQRVKTLRLRRIGASVSLAYSNVRNLI